MATLVTGGTGFVGTNIVKALVERGHRVVCFDLIAPDPLFQKYLNPWRDQVTSVQGDILNPVDLQQAAAQQPIDKIVHAAVFTPNRASNVETERSRDIVSINIKGTTNLLELARDLTLKRFLYVSSEAVYGERPLGVELVHEDAPLQPRNLYAISKYTSELLTRRYGELHGFQTVSVRLSYPYGPMERATNHRTRLSLIYQLTGNIVRGEPIVVGDLTQGRDYTFVGDVAAAIGTVLDAPSLPHDVYNVSAGHPTTLEEVVDALRRLCPSLQVTEAPAEDLLSFRPETPYAVRDVARIKDDLDYTPSYDIAAGLKAYLDWRDEFSFRD